MVFPQLPSQSYCDTSRLLGFFLVFETVKFGTTFEPLEAKRLVSF